eukprot:2698364-Rhodomonas_salina.1
MLWKRTIRYWHASEKSTPYQRQHSSETSFSSPYASWKEEGKRGRWRGAEEGRKRGVEEMGGRRRGERRERRDGFAGRAAEEARAQCWEADG